MADTTVDISQSLDAIQKLLKLIDNGDGTFSISSAFPSSQLIAIDSVTGDISTNNSTTTTLGSGGVFTGVKDTVTDYKSIGVNVIASHASATNGVTFQFSSDGTNWDKVHSFTLPAATAKFFNLPVEAKFFRIVYTNSASVQTYFRMQTIYHATTTKESTLRISEDIDGETAAQFGRMVIAGKVDGTYKNIILDRTTAGLPTIDWVHHETHEGDSFAYSEVTDLGNGAVRDILVVTPNTARWAHMTVTVQTELEADYKLYAETTASANGTACTALNRNRNSATAATTLVFHTPTVAGGSEGTLLDWRHWGSGKGAGGGERGSDEWILKQNKKYLIRVTNSTTSSNQVNIALNWYEHTDEA